MKNLYGICSTKAYMVLKPYVKRFFTILLARATCGRRPSPIEIDADEAQMLFSYDKAQFTRCLEQLEQVGLINALWQKEEKCYLVEISEDWEEAKPPRKKRRRSKESWKLKLLKEAGIVKP